MGRNSLGVWGGGVGGGGCRNGLRVGFNKGVSIKRKQLFDGIYLQRTDDSLQILIGVSKVQGVGEIKIAGRKANQEVGEEVSQ